VSDQDAAAAEGDTDQKAGRRAPASGILQTTSRMKAAASTKPQDFQVTFRLLD